jgi:hypothetical protein
MPPSDDNNDGSFWSSKASSNYDDAPQQSQSPEVDEEDKYNDNTGSQVMLDIFDPAETGFLTPGGLSLFSVALSLKAERILFKNLPKTINPSGISKKNFRVTITMLNVGAQC